MPNCPKCNNMLTISYDSIYECTKCDFIIRISKFEKEYDATKESWYISVCKDNSLWFKDNLHRYPSIIAHEYHRLYELLKNGQTYGGFFQLKDMLEVLLKFPILIAMSNIYNKENKSLKEMELVVSSFEKTLGLGDWRKFINIIYKENLFNDPVVYPILKDIRNIYFDEKLDIVKWRNEAIGHGALKFDSDIKFQQEIIERLRIIKTHFERCNKYYEKLDLYLNMDNTKLELRGIDNATSLPVNNNIFLNTGLIILNLYPYILIDNGDIFFYDTFIDKKLKISILNYPNGDKKDIIKDPISDYYHSLYIESVEALKKAGITERFDQRDDSTEDDNYLAESERDLNEIRNVVDYTNPQYVEDWLKEKLKTSSKGLLLLQMERGMGKTTFAKAIDENGFYKIKFEDFSTRGYYLNDTYLSDLNYFFSGISDLLRTDGEGKIIIKEKDLKILSSDAISIKKDLSNLLFQYKEKFKKYYGKSKLLLIIDGIDELPNNFEKSILNILPNNDELTEGVFILLTCRINEELSPHILEGIANLNIASENHIIFDRYSKENSDLLKSYIIQELKPKTEDIILLLLDKAEYRFLYLSMLKTMIKDLGEVNLKLLPQGESIFDKFLDKLKFYFGDKYFRGLQKVLCIIASAMEPLTMKEIAYLCGEDKITFKLLSYLYAIQGLLRSDRSYRGNLLSISHIELKHLIVSKYELIAISILKEWVNKLSHLDNSEDLSINDGEFYLISNILNYTDLGLNVDFSPILNEDFYLYLINEAEIHSKTNYKLHVRKRYFAIYSQLIKLQKLSFGKIDTPTLYLIGATSSSRLGDALFENLETDYEASIEMYIEAINYRQLLLKTVYNIDLDYLSKDESKRDDYSKIELFVIKDIAEDYINIGRVYYRVGIDKKALTYCDNGIHLYNKYLDLDDKSDKFKLSESLLELARIYCISNSLDNNYDLALDVANKVLNLQEELLRDGMEIEGFIARTEDCIGTTYELMKDTDHALGIFNNAIERLKKLPEDPAMSNERFITVLNNKIGNIYQSERNFEGSIPYYSNTIAIFLKLEALNIFYEKTKYVFAHKNLGLAYLDLGNHNKSIFHFKKALELSENSVPMLMSSEKTYCSFRFEVYIGMADGLFLLKCYEECLIYYDKWLDLICNSRSADSLITVEDLHVTLKRMYESYNCLGRLKQLKLQYSRLEKLESKFLRSKALLTMSELKFVLNFSEDISLLVDVNKSKSSFPYGYFIVDRENHIVIKCSKSSFPLECRYSVNKKTFGVKFNYKQCKECSLVDCPAKKNNGIVKFSEKIWLQNNLL